MTKIIFALLLAASTLSATTYYVSASGSSSNTGTSAASTWNLDAVCDHDFATSDTILFKRGDVIYGEISHPTFGSAFNGTANAPFYFGAYGTGNNPIIMMDCSNLVWTKRAGYDSIYVAWCGYTYGTIGYEYIDGVWTSMTNNQGSSIRTRINNPDTLIKYLDTFTPSMYGPALHESAVDSVYIRTHDGNPPIVKILRQSFLFGDYMKWENVEFQNGYHALNFYPANNSRLHKLRAKNFIGITFFLANYSSYNVVDSCRIDSTAYTSYYSWYGQRNKFTYDTSITIRDTIMGIYSNIEQTGFGFERDTGSVLEYSYVEGADMGGMDAFYNAQDTVRYSKFVNCMNGISLHGDRWVGHNNYISVTTGFGISVDICRYTTDWATTGGLTSGAGQTHAYNNTVINAGRGLNFSSNVAQGSVLFENNAVVGNSSTDNLVMRETLGATSINNRFYGLGRWGDGDWPNYVFYSSLTAYRDATGYESGSTWSETYTPPDPEIPAGPARKVLIRRYH